MGTWNSKSGCQVHLIQHQTREPASTENSFDLAQGTYGEPNQIKTCPSSIHQMSVTRMHEAAELSQMYCKFILAAFRIVRNASGPCLQGSIALLQKASHLLVLMSGHKFVSGSFLFTNCLYTKVDTPKLTTDSAVSCSHKGLKQATWILDRTTVSCRDSSTQHTWMRWLSRPWTALLCLLCNIVEAVKHFQELVAVKFAEPCDYKPPTPYSWQLECSILLSIWTKILSTARKLPWKLPWKLLNQSCQKAALNFSPLEVSRTALTIQQPSISYMLPVATGFSMFRIQALTGRVLCRISG